MRPTPTTPQRSMRLEDMKADGTGGRAQDPVARRRMEGPAAYGVLNEARFPLLSRRLTMLSCLVLTAALATPQAGPSLADSLSGRPPIGAARRHSPQIYDVSFDCATYWRNTSTGA